MSFDLQQHLREHPAHVVLILGMGQTGAAAERFFQKLGIETLCFDDRNPCYVQDAREIPWDEIAAVVQSPGVSTEHPVRLAAMQHQLPVLSDVDVFIQFVPSAQYVGITGTNGKSTTTALIHHILKQGRADVFLGGNIGAPVLDLPVCPGGLYVLELSSYQLELSHALHLDAAVWTNLTEDHLARHKTMEQYIAAKERIFTNAKFAALGVDDEASARVFQRVKDSGIKTLSVSIQHEADCYLGPDQSVMWEGKCCSLAHHPHLIGAHNFQNMLLAYVTARQFGLSDEVIQGAIFSFKGLPHRIETIAQKCGVLFVNDSKATNADATIKALTSFPNAAIYLIAGGRAKHDGIRPALPSMHHVRQIFLIGEAAERFANEIGNTIPYQQCGTLRCAVEAAYHAAKRDAQSPIVLLSPACASFDQFTSFEDRGDCFRRIVHDLVEDESIA